MGNLEINKIQPSRLAIALKDVGVGQIFRFAEDPSDTIYLRLNHSNYYISLESGGLYSIHPRKDIEMKPVFLVYKATLNIEF